MALSIGMDLKKIQEAFLEMHSRVFQGGTLARARYIFSKGSGNYDGNILNEVLKEMFGEASSRALSAATGPGSAFCSEKYLLTAQCFVVTATGDTSVPQVYLLRNYPTPIHYDS